MNSIKSLCFSLLILSTVSCHKVKIEDNPSEKTSAIHVAKQFLKAHTNSDLETLMQISDVPFYADGRHLKSIAELKKLSQSSFKSKPLKYTINGIKFFTFEDSAIFYPKLLKKLHKKQFDISDTYLIIASLNVETMGNEVVFFMVKKVSDQWRIVGIKD